VTTLNPNALASVKRRDSDGGDRRLVSITAPSVDVALAEVDRLAGESWCLGLVFARSAQALQRAGDHLGQALAGIEIAGCTSAGILDREANVAAEVQITLFGGSGLASAVARASLEQGSSRAAGSAAAEAVDRLGGRYDQTVLILLVDGLVGDTNDVVRGAYETVGASVPIVGGCAGDDLAMVATHQLAGNQLGTSGVVGIALSSSASFGIGVNHGWSPLGQPMTVTAAEGTSILTLDDRPALDVYLEAIGGDDGNLTNSGLAVRCQTRPFGLQSRGTYHVRFVRGGDLERRSIEFLVAIPEGETVTLMQGDAESVIGAAGTAVAQALTEIEGPPLGILAFDCVACRGVIGDECVPTEVNEVTSHLADDSILSGLYTYGEIARRGGALGFHNQTMVVLAIS